MTPEQEALALHAAEHGEPITVAGRRYVPADGGPRPFGIAGRVVERDDAGNPTRIEWISSDDLIWCLP